MWFPVHTAGPETAPQCGEFVNKAYMDDSPAVNRLCRCSGEMSPSQFRGTMPKQQIVSSKLRQPSGHFSHATVVAAQGRLVFISGKTAPPADHSIARIG